MNDRALSALRYLKYCFSVEAVDARIKPDADYIKRQKGALEADTDLKDGRRAPRPLWGTLEFKFYYVAFALVVPLMLKTAVDAASERNTLNYPRFQHLLSQGWLFGRMVDNSDAQYRFFRDNLLLLTQLMLAHLALKRVVLYCCHGRLSVRNFDCLCGLGFLVAAHGANSLRILLHMGVMFVGVRLLRKHRHAATAFTWCYGIGALFLNDRYRTVPFASVASVLAPLDSAFKGIIPRWDVFFNFSLLRIISYNLDYLERLYSQLQFQGTTVSSPQSEDEDMYGTAAGSAVNGTSVQRPNDELDDDDIQINKPVFKKSGSVARLQTIDEAGKDGPPNERARLTFPHHIQEYNLANYTAYVLYTPLFIAGPIVTFNDYLCQTQRRLPSITRERLAIYTGVLLFTMLMMELILHFAYVVAVSKTHAWAGDTPFQLSMIGLVNLNVIWLKLLIPWRFFRLWAMLDGIDTPENMIRLVDNNYSALAFWRGWHRSFNKWVVRYIYIPLGGSRNRILTSLAVFSFVAVWHDIELRLLLWGWLIVVFLLPEILLSEFFQVYRNRWWYRHVCALGGTLNIYMMMAANLFGFCLGSDGTKTLLHDMFMTAQGVRFLCASTVCLFIAVQIMFEIREDEKRHGINLRC